MEKQAKSHSDDGEQPEDGAFPSPQSPDADSEHGEGVLVGVLDTTYEAKTRVLNNAIADIGMGWYQWQLFVVVGFGWASDNLWPVAVSLILPPMAKEFNVDRPPLLSLAQNLGLLGGAIFWGFGCDIFGRKWGFNLTLGVTAVWSLVAAGSPTFAALGTFCALWSFGVGGNLPVDSALFLEFLPQSHQWLLTTLSVDWAVAQIVTNLVAWPFLGSSSLNCSTEQDVCTKSENMGWRYFLITMGGLTCLMFLIRFVAFTIFESPKYLMSKGYDEDAVRVVQEVARRNGTSSSLSVADLKTCEPDGHVTQTGASEAIKRRLENLGSSRVKTLFATKKLGLSTGLIMAVWAFIGLGYPLYNAYIPYITESRGATYGDGSTYITYRNNLIIATVGLPGALISGWLIELPYFGRKGALALFTALTGVFLYASTTSSTSNALLGWNCGFNFASSAMYAVLYGYTPEVFPTSQRGTGNALTATCNRVFGIMANTDETHPIIAMFANLETSAPVYTSGALFFAAGCLVLCMPFESRGKAAM